MHSQLEDDGKYIEAKVFLHKNDEIRYYFVLAGNSYNGSARIEANKNEWGIPIQNGDEYFVRYMPNNPNINHLKFQFPSQRLWVKYREMLVSFCQTNGVYENCACVAEEIIKIPVITKEIPIQDHETMDDWCTIQYSVQRPRSESTVKFATHLMTLP